MPAQLPSNRIRISATTAAALGLPMLLLLTLWLLWPGTHGPFIFDDFPYFAHLQKLGRGVTWAAMGEYLASYAGPMGRALSMASFVLNDHDWPSTPDTFKRTNLLIHLLNGVLAFGLARSVALARVTPPRAAVIGLAVAALWLLHPIQVSAVFLTVQRITMLSALFVFAALWAYVALLRRARNTRGMLLTLAALGGLTAVGVLAKENAVLAFLFAAVLNATVLSQHVAALHRRDRWLLRTATLGPILLAIAVMALKWHDFNAYVIRDFTPYERLMTEGRVLVDYAGRLLLPSPGGSGLFNDDYVISRGWTSPLSTLLSWLAISALIASALVLRRRLPLYGFAVLWFFSGHLIESTVLDLELYFEHRNYVPWFGPAFALAAALVESRGKLRNVYRAAVIIWLALMTFNSAQQAKIWGNEILLALVWGAEHPDSVRANQKLADSYFRMGQPAKAREALAKPLERGIAPAVFSTQLILLDCANFGQVSPQLVRRAAHALATDKPSYSTGPTLRDIRIRVTGGACKTSVDWATWFALTDAALANPLRASYEGYVRIERGYAYRSLGRLDDAVSEFELGYAINPEPDLALLIYSTLIDQKRYEEAATWLEHARTAPTSRWRGWITNRDGKIEALECGLARVRGLQPPHEGCPPFKQ